MYALLVAFLTLRLTGAILFERDLYEAYIYQHAPAKTPITRVKAMHEDSRNEPISYYIGVDQEDFYIGEFSGQLKSKRIMSNSLNTTYQIPVIGTLSGQVNLTYVRIQVTPYNDYPPRFKRNFQIVTIFRNTPYGSYITRAQATDHDTPQYMLSFEIEKSQHSKRFIIDEKSGNISLLGPLPKRKQAIKLTVLVHDLMSPPKQDETTVLISIKDISVPGIPMLHNNTLTSAYVCWSRPGSGMVWRYVVEFWRYGYEGYKSNVTVTDSDDSITCYNLTGLIAWKQYYVRVIGMSQAEASPPSGVLAFKTSIKGCMYSPCQNGACELTEKHPGYICTCHPGYYGFNCEHFDFCSISPCRHNATCTLLGTSDYQCECAFSFFGRNCSYQNPCLLEPCEHGTCRNTSSNGFVCKCKPGYYGEKCQFLNPCHFHTCENGATCVNTSTENYTCKCAHGYYGSVCQHDHPCKYPPCLNGTCRPLDGDRYRCDCNLGYYGEHCEYFDPCALDPCQHGGTCTNVEIISREERPAMKTIHDKPFGKNRTKCTGSKCRRRKKGGYRVLNGDPYYCICAPGYEGSRCQTPKCIAHRTVDKAGLIDWPAMSHSQTASALCPYGPKQGNHGKAYRHCKLAPDGEAVWDEQQTHACRQSGSAKAANLVKDMRSMSSDPANLLPDDILKITTGIERILPFTYSDKEIAKSMVDVISNVLLANTSVIQESEIKSEVPSRLIKVVDNYLKNVNLDKEPDLTVSSSNLKLRAIDVAPKAFIKLFIEFKPVGDDPVEKILLPAEILTAGGGDPNDKRRVQLASFANSKLYVEKKKKNLGEFTDMFLDKQKVFMASVKGKKIFKLKTPVKYILSTRGAPNTTCVYWDKYEKRWSSSGIKGDNMTNPNYTTCSANHMTSFAVLLDPSPWATIEEVHLVAMTYITYIGCGVSLLGLVLTLLTYCLFKCLWCDKSGKILINLCVAMLLLNICFLLAAHKATLVYNPICIIFSVLLHYFLLTTMMWMCVEAVNMYQMLVTVFKSYEANFIVKRCLAAWGLPVVVVGIAVAVDYSNYMTEAMCMISDRNPYLYYITFLSPCCLILIINSIVFIMVARVIMKPKMHGRVGMDAKQVTKLQLRGAVTVMILLGITWVFGMFAFGKAKTVFQYVFCITNSLQGFFIFLVRCLMHPEAKAAWLQLLKEGTIKQTKGVTRSVTDSSASRHDLQTDGKSSSGSCKKMSTSSSALSNTSIWNVWRGSKTEKNKHRNHNSVNGKKPTNVVVTTNPLCDETKYMGREDGLNSKDEIYLNNHQHVVGKSEGTCRDRVTYL
ncbi:uncharacterized protein LOC135490733 isoform X2 [Lineus longissimus]|uniref:uncharacterized protein LOC135490733 isoform X2 n=1 Tax=Lineus longissimus TaxID=88925 RepID=UPI00315CD0DB